MNKKVLLLLILISLFTSAIYAQSDEKKQEISQLQSATVAQMSYLSGCSLGILKDQCSFDNAYFYLLKYQILGTPGFKSTDPLTVDTFAYFCDKTFFLSGGIMYTLTKGSMRYTIKQMKADGVIPVDYDPYKVLSGTELNQLFENCLALYKLRTDTQFTNSTNLK